LAAEIVSTNFNREEAKRQCGKAELGGNMGF
jgi:hypothetical protein